MKNLIIIIIISVLAFTISSNSLYGQSDRDQIEVQVDGLGCPFCASYPSEKGMTLEQVESQVDKAGYTAVTTKIIRADGTIEESKQNITELTDESTIVSKDIFVAGNCGMCKARIEKTAKSIEGVVKAEWDKDNKMLKLEYDSSQTSIGEVSESIAKAGHDTKYSKAEDGVYNDLPGCCQYERVQ